MKEEKKTKGNIKWFIEVSILAFTLSIIFSFLSNNAVVNLSILPAMLVLLAVIFVGIIFDIIGVAVTVADENEFHAMATKKVVGAKTAIKLIKNASQVSNLCADVIGDICGVLSGGLSAAISLKIMSNANIPIDIQFIISAFVASITIGGKALGKGFARKNSTKIIFTLGKILSNFKIEK